MVLMVSEPETLSPAPKRFEKFITWGLAIKVMMLLPVKFKVPLRSIAGKLEEFARIVEVPPEASTK